MPCQVSWHFVATKSQKLMHGLGAEAAVAEAVVGMTSAAHASISHEAPAAARIVAAKMLSFAMRARCFDMDGIVTWQQLVDKPRPAPYAAMAGKSDPCG